MDKKKELLTINGEQLLFFQIKNEGFVYLIIFIKSELTKYFANSRSVAAFLANEESLATALFRLLVYIERLLVLAPNTAIR